MKRMALTISVLAVSAALCAGLAGCGGSSSDSGSSSASTDSVTATQTATTASLTPAANVNPKEVDPGSIQDASASTTSDIWTCADGSGFYLMHSSGDTGRSITMVDANGKEGSSTNKLEITSDNHLKTTSESKMDMDLLFYDQMNAYDAVTSTWYTRGNLDQLKAVVADKTFVYEDDDTFSYTFNADGTFVITDKGKTYDGTWEIINCEQVSAGEGTDTGTYKFYFSENGKDTFDGYITSLGYKYVLK